MTKKILSCILALLTILPFVFLAEAAQGEPSSGTWILWAHLYTQYEDTYLVGKTNYLLHGVNEDIRSVDLVCRLTDGTEIELQTESGALEDAQDDARYFIIPIVVDDPLAIQSIAVSFPENYFRGSWQEGYIQSPAFTYMAEDLAADEPIFCCNFFYRSRSWYSVKGECRGTKLYVPLPLDQFMFIPLQKREECLAAITFDFGKKMIPTRYTYDGQTLVISRLGDYSQNNQLYIGEEIIRSFQIQYKDITQEFKIHIEPSFLFLCQQRRVLWVFLISGGLFERIKRFFIKYFLLEGEDPWE